MKSSKPKPKRQESALLGIGFDGDDGVTRLTRGDEFVLFGGSPDTHSVMQEAVIKVAERLKARGKRISDASAAELKDTFRDVTGRE